MRTNDVLCGNTGQERPAGSSARYGRIREYGASHWLREGGERELESGQSPGERELEQARQCQSEAGCASRGRWYYLDTGRCRVYFIQPISMRLTSRKSAVSWKN